MRVLLDTAALILSVEAPERLGPRAAAVLEDEANLLEISSVSISEIAVKAARGKLKLTADAVRQALSDLDIRVLSYTAEHAFTLFDLPLHHADPFDRQIIAQALTEEIPIVTSDRIFRRYRGLKLIW